jgi:RND family efflux transporter MFP subunit
MIREQQRPRAKKTIVLAVPTPRGDDGASLFDGLVEPAAPSRPRRWLGKLLLGVGLLALTGLGISRWQHSASANALESSEVQSAARRVHVTRANRLATGEVTLPGNLMAYQGTEVFARVNGYVTAWKVDLGARVKAGELLAEIDTPELDQELAQARATLVQGEAELVQARAELEEARADARLSEANLGRARANFDFAVTQRARQERLLNNRAGSKEDYDSTFRDQETRGAEVEAAAADLKRRETALQTRKAAIDSREAAVKSRWANVARLEDLQRFKQVVAPFDALVTRRFAEVGMLVSAGSTSGTRPLYSLAQDHKLRVQVAVPQANVAQARVGHEAAVRVPEHPASTFPATVARTASAIDPATRTLLVELELDNTDRQLVPGAYAQVSLRGRGNSAWLIPVSTLLMRNDGPYVALAEGGALRLVKVRLGRDYGSKVEALAGVTGGETLVVNPADDFRDGLPVEILSDATANGK